MSKFTVDKHDPQDHKALENLTDEIAKYLISVGPKIDSLNAKEIARKIVTQVWKNYE